MAKNTYNSANVVPTYDTFAGWLSKTNQIIYDMGTYVLTTSNTSNPDITTGNAFVNGFFGTGTSYVTTALRGGTGNTSANLSITSGLVVANQVWTSANVNITGSANVSVNVNSAGVTTTNITANAISTRNLTSNGTIAANNLTSANAVLTLANVATANIATLGVTTAATIADLSIGVTDANVQVTTSQITVSGNATTFSSINSTSFSGTSNNSINFSGLSLATVQSQITGNAATAYSNATVFASNASNINTGTLANARLSAQVVNTSAAFTITGVHTHNANVVINGNSSSALLIGIGTSNLIANSTDFILQGNSTVGAFDANTTVVTVGNSTVFTTVNSTSFSGTANNSLNLGGSTLATIQGQITGNAATSYTNATNFVTTGGYTITGNVTVTGNATSVVTVGNTTANVVTNSTSVRVNGNTTTFTTINSTAFSGTSNNSTNFGGLSLATVQGQITGNAATAYSNAAAYADTKSSAAYSNAAAYADTKSSAAYTNAVTFAANATNINSGTLDNARLSSQVVNTSGSFTFSGIQTFNANVALAGNATSTITAGNSTINTFANSTTVAVRAGTTAGAVIINATAVNIGNATSNSTLTSTTFSGTANNATNLGGTAASGYQTTAGLAANVLVLPANSASFLGNSSGTLANIASWTTTNAAAAYTNAVAIANASVTNGFWVAANATYAANAGALGGVAANMTAPTDGYVIAYDAASSKLIFKNPSNISVALNANTVVANLQLQAGSNGTTYVANVYGNSTVTAATLRANTIVLAVDSGAISLNSSVVVSGTLYNGNSTANTQVNSSTFYVSSNSTTFTTINSTAFSGTANNSSYLNGTTLSTIQGQITGNAATAYSNAVSVAASDATSKAATAYTNAVTFSANASNLGNGTVPNARLTAANTTTAGIVQLVDSVTNTSITHAATPNSVKTAADSATAAYSNATTFASNASNITTGTLAIARIPAGVVNTSGSFTFSGVQTFNANVTLAGNSTSVATVGNSTIGVAVNSTSVTLTNSDNVATFNATSFSRQANGATYLGPEGSGATLSTIETKINSAYTNSVSDAAASAAALYFTKTGGLISGDVTVSGNLNITGTTFYANVTNLDVKDINITVAKGAASNAASDGAGLTVDVPNAQFFYSASANSWAVNRSFTPNANVTFNIGNTTNFWNSAFVTTINLNGTSSINATTFTGTSNNSTNFGGLSLATVQGQITGNAATAYSNAVAAATSDATSKAATAYSNATAYADTKAGTAYTNATVFASNASNINTGTLAYARLPANVVFWSNTNTFTAPQTFNANAIITGNATAQLIVGTSTDGVNVTSTTINTGNSTVFTTVNSTAFSGTSNNSTNFDGLSLATVQGQITGNAATAYTNATVFASNASNINSGTLAYARLPANVVFWSNNNTFTGTQTFNANVTISGNTTALLTIGTAADGVDANSSVISIGNATVYTTINSTAFSGTANNSTNLGGSSLATVQGQITGNAATAYTNAVATAASDASSKAATAYSNAVTYSSNATNLSSGTVNPARLGSGTANSSTVLFGNNVWAAPVNLAAPGPIGASTPNTAVFSTVTLGSATTGVFANTSRLSIASSSSFAVLIQPDGAAPTLDVPTPSNGTTGGIRIRGNATSGQAYMQFTDSAATAQWGVLQSNSTGQLGWGGGIACGGGLGVGTAPGTTGEIRATDNITAYYSDRRLKDIEGTIPNALDKVMSLSGIYFRSNDEAAKYGYTNTKRQVGVIAQEIKEVLPEIVVPAPFDIGQNEDGTEYSLSGKDFMTVQYDKIVPLLIEAIKEQQVHINNLEEKINSISENK